METPEEAVALIFLVQAAAAGRGISEENYL